MKEPPFGQVTIRSPKPKLPACWPKICTFFPGKKVLFVHVQAHTAPRCLGHDAGPLAPQPAGQGCPCAKHICSGACAGSAKIRSSRRPRSTAANNKTVQRREAKPAQHLGDESGVSGMREAPNFKQKQTCNVQLSLLQLGTAAECHIKWLH